MYESRALGSAKCQLTLGSYTEEVDDLNKSYGSNRRS